MQPSVGQDLRSQLSGGPPASKQQSSNCPLAHELEHGADRATMLCLHSALGVSINQVSSRHQQLQCHHSSAGAWEIHPSSSSAWQACPPLQSLIQSGARAWECILPPIQIVILLKCSIHEPFTVMSLALICLTCILHDAG